MYHHKNDCFEHRKFDVVIGCEKGAIIITIRVHHQIVFIIGCVLHVKYKSPDQICKCCIYSDCGSQELNAKGKEGELYYSLHVLN